MGAAVLAAEQAARFARAFADATSSTGQDVAVGVRSPD